jgi:hypothetical protein
VIVDGPIVRRARAAGARAKVVRLAENRGKWPHIRTNCDLNKDVLQVTNRRRNRGSRNEALIRIAIADRRRERRRCS